MPNAQRTPAGCARPQIPRFVIFAGCFLFALLAAAPHSAQKEPAAREPKIWIEASHSFVCPDDGSANLPLRVRGVGERCQPRYSWTVNGGFIEGVGAGIVWNLSGVRPQPDKYYDAVVTVNTGPACGSRKVSAIWRACVVCPPRFVPPPPLQTPPRFCPAISFGARATATTGQDVAVTATLSDAAPGVTPRFKWTVLQGGRINGGQGTNSILVGAGNAGQTILAKVEVRVYRSGPSCSATASIPIVPAPPPPPLTLRVSVRNARDGRPVPRAKTTFYLDGRAVLEDALTGDDGILSRAGWTPGIYRVVVSADRFDRQETTVTLDHSSNGPLVLSLTPLNAQPTPTSSPTPSPTSNPTPSPTSSPTPSPSSTPEPSPTPTVTPTPEPTAEPVFAVLSANWRWIPFLVIALAALAAAASAFLKPAPTVEPPPPLPPLVDDEAARGAAQVPGDEVHCTVYAPTQTSPGASFMVVAFAHLEEHAELLEEKAKERDDTVVRRGSEELDETVARGQELTFQLEMPGMEVDEPSQSFKWKGKLKPVEFCVKVPKVFEEPAVNCKLLVLCESVPIGHVKFKLNVTTAATATQTPAPEPQAFLRYKNAFISYASEDRPEVLRRVQMLDTVGINYFQDVLSLKPGERWEKMLYKHIDECDVVFLFWSVAAHESQWVEKEVKYAIEHKHGQQDGLPEIVPVILDGPREAPPPPYLSEYHFNDKFNYFIKVEDAARRPPLTG